MRDNGCDSLLDEVVIFCNHHDIEIPIVDDVRVLKGRPNRKAPTITNLHYYKVSVFCEVLNMQPQEIK